MQCFMRKGNDIKIMIRLSQYTLFSAFAHIYKKLAKAMILSQILAIDSS